MPNIVNDVPQSHRDLLEMPLVATLATVDPQATYDHSRPLSGTS